MPEPRADAAFEVSRFEALGATLRAHLPGRSWSEVRRLISSGKVTIDGAIVLEPGFRVEPGARVSLRMSAPDPRKQRRPDGFKLVFEDAHIVIIEKPDGVSTVPYERKESGTALDLIRDEWRRQGRKATTTPLYVVHRIDKDTSGLLAFAKTKLAERGMHHIFKNHLAERSYLAVAHGFVNSQRIESSLVADRGDGLRGSTRFRDQGQHAVSHVTAVERLAGATLCRVRLETGRTHQIRIHLAEAGHPLVGETVYVRDLRRAGGHEVQARRLLLHAETLAFEHPVTKTKLAFSAPLPPVFVAEVERLKRAPA